MMTSPVAAPPAPIRRPPAAEGQEAAGPDLAWRLESTALQLLLVAGLTATATSGWVRVAEGGQAVVAVALGAVGPPALALGLSAARRRPWPAWAAVLGHAAFLAVLAVVVAGGPGAATRALTGGWARLLSTILPAPAGSEAEVLALVVAGITSLVGTELALRTRSPFLPVVPALVALVATRMVTQGAAERGLVGAAVGVALLAGALALVRAGVVRLGLGLPLVLAAGLVAGGAGPTLPWADARPAFDPRALRDVSSLEASAVNPLARLRAWQASPDRVLFRARLSAPATLRLAVLDRYDGARFSASSQFTPAGAALPPLPDADPGAGGPTRTVTADVVIAALDGPWVPSPDRASRINGPPVAVDPTTGVVVVPGGVRAGQRFRVTAEVAIDQRSRLPGTTAASARQVGAAAVEVPPALPRELGDLARTAAGGGDDPALTRLGRLQELFRTGFSEDPASPTGHSLARLTSFLDPDDRVGSVEQLATAFALLARTLGYPTRVAVGFRPAGAGDVAVRGGDARAWPEVALAGVGWVAFDPVPAKGAAPAPDRPPEEVEAAAAAAEAAASSSIPPAPTPPPAPVPPPPAEGARPWLVLAGAGTGAVVLLVALGLGLVVGAKRRRRSARRATADPGARVRGAWAEAAERLVERGLGRPPSRTPRDAAQAVAAVAPAAAPPLADLGDLAERAAFAGPGAVSPPDADRAWADLDLLEAALAANDSRLASVGRLLDPRPLRA